ncbi:MAG TPA: tetratricopeptide repeat protein [Gemmatimonadaceae bacterium]|nr:tetratricopeptide repeat protein [Gemmatimonadaceae bacterium]
MKTALINQSIDAGEQAKLRGDYLEARSAFETALEDSDPLVVGTAWHCLGKLAWHEGAFESAGQYFEKARAIAMRLDAAELRARSEIGLGGVYFARGDYHRARQFYEGIRANPLGSEFKGMVALNLGAIANIEGDIAAAERHYTRASRAFAEVGDVAGQAQAWHNLGMLHADRLEWDQADEAYGRSLELSEQTGNREMVGMVIMNRSEMSCAMGRYEEAVARCDAALTIFAEIGAEVLRGTTLRWKGRALRELGQYVLAERALTEAMRIAHRAQARLLEAETMQELGAMLALSGDGAAGRKWLQRSLDMFKALGATRESNEVEADLRALEP